MNPNALGACSGSQARGLCALIVRARVEHVTELPQLQSDQYIERPMRGQNDLSIWILTVNQTSDKDG